MEKERDSITGKLVPDLERFPSGLKVLSNYVSSYTIMCQFNRNIIVILKDT